MWRSITRASAAIAAGAALSALGVTAVSAAGPAIRVPQHTAAPARPLSIPGTQLWASRYNGTGGTEDMAKKVAVSPDGSRVFVTGGSVGAREGWDYVTVAYNAATGGQLWVKRYNGHDAGWDEAQSLAVSPDGGRVFVTGRSEGATSGSDYATIAYNAATGAQLWVHRYNGPGNANDSATAVAVSPGGRTVFVTGGARVTAESSDYATIAYSAATGAQLWVRRYNGPGNGNDSASSLAVSPGGTVFVTGQSRGSGSGPDYATVAYNAASGTRLWVNRYHGHGWGYDGATALAVSPNGGKVYITGYSPGAFRNADYATIAYSAAGTQLWVKRYNGPGNGMDGATSVAVSPDGSKVFVTGYSKGTSPGFDYATIAYSATGARLWVHRYNGPGRFYDVASSVAAARNGKVYVTGQSDGIHSRDYATIAYSVRTGDQLWVRRYDPFNGDDRATSVAVSTGRVFVTGRSSTDAGSDYATIAYNG